MAWWLAWLVATWRMSQHSVMQKWDTKSELFSFIFGLNLTWLVWLFWVFHPFKPEFNSCFIFFAFGMTRACRDLITHGLFMFHAMSLSLSLCVFLWKGRLMLPAPLRSFSSGHAVLLCHCLFCLVGPWMPTIWSRHQKPCHCHLVTNI